MELRIRSFVQTACGPKLVDIFGYSSRSLPQLEIHAPLPIQKVLKQKILYLSKDRNLEIPAKRFVLCLDHGGLRLDADQLFQLELPFLVLFWALAEVVQVKRLEDCICNGSISIDGTINSMNFNSVHLNILKQRGLLKIISNYELEGFHIISLESLINPLGQFQVLVTGT